MRLPTIHRPRPVGTPPFADALSRTALHVGLSIALLTNAVQTPPAIAYSPFTEEQKIVAEAWKVTDREYVDRDFSGQDWFKTRQKMISQKYASKEEVRARPHSATASSARAHTPCRRARLVVAWPAARAGVRRDP